MKQVLVTGVNETVLVDKPPRQRRAGDLLLAINACGICGSDVHYVKQGGAFFQTALPMSLGHEICGTVIDAGDARTLKNGQRVVLIPSLALTYGAIGNGGEDGGFAEHLRIASQDADQALMPIPDSLPSDIAALAEPLAVGLHAVNRSGVRPGQRVVVLGAGCIGLSIIAGLRARGIQDIVAVDLSVLRLETARRLGAKETIQTDQADLRARLAELHGEVSVFGLPAVGSDLYFDTTAVPSVLRQTIAMARQQAVIVYVGVYAEEVAIDLQQALHREIDLRGSLAYVNEFEEALALLSDQDLDLAAMISHRFPLDQWDQAFAAASDSCVSNKVMITC